MFTYKYIFGKEGGKVLIKTDFFIYNKAKYKLFISEHGITMFKEVVNKIYSVCFNSRDKAVYLKAAIVYSFYFKKEVRIV